MVLKPVRTGRVNSLTFAPNEMPDHWPGSLQTPSGKMTNQTRFIILDHFLDIVQAKTDTLKTWHVSLISDQTVVNSEITLTEPVFCHLNKCWKGSFGSVAVMCAHSVSQDRLLHVSPKQLDFQFVNQNTKLKQGKLSFFCGEEDWKLAIHATCSNCPFALCTHRNDSSTELAPAPSWLVFLQALVNLS